MALLAAWVTMVFGTSALVALSGNGPGKGRWLPGLAGETVQGADDIGPAAKLLLIALFAVLVLLGERVPMAPWRRLALNAALGAAAMLLALALLPAPLSRGFGIGLTGARFDPAVLSLYILGGVLGGAAYTVSVARCRARL